MQPPAGLSPEAQAMWMMMTANNRLQEARKRQAEPFLGFQQRPRRQAMTPGGTAVPITPVESVQPVVDAMAAWGKADQLRARTENENTAKLGMKPETFPALDDEGNVMPRGPGMAQAPMLARFRSMVSGGPTGGEQWWQQDPSQQSAWWDQMRNWWGNG
jgi:hypothetical protein